ncbi:hypothetical protein IMF27_02700 [Pseudomonas sp. PCH199]|uniref:hypothetical protein n=1 Tax=unclassified Pseudomonas TaxID=196821 RepID=UPI000BD43DFE|nr:MULTISPECIES: hypothetical protein [unclassified Pseudomonas]MCW8274749.1 hypothetical protein [Pseudomonas sp. PCH199]PAM85412.1 hypothetical protein CES87_02750 [Pseudomonas sp. ERMR1:02]
MRNIDTTKSVDFFRETISKEKIVILDFTYLAGTIESWWKKNNLQDTHILKIQLINIFLNYLRAEDIFHFDKVGLSDGGAAVCIKNIFSIDSPKLALTVHEALADLFHLTDIEYKYEEHKALYLKPSAEKHREWGNGFGYITPHSDDLYENLNVDYLALTVCRDITKTPTAYYFPKDLLCELSDEEIAELLSMQATFISGKNVNGLKKRVRHIVEYSDIYGFHFSLDFRVDPQNGERMRAINNGQHVLDKIRAGLPNAKNHYSTAQTGTFLIIANHKVLHARSTLNIDANEVREQAKHSTFNTTPRLLFRSKGPRKQYHLLDKTTNMQVAG